MMTADPARQALVDRTSELIEDIEASRLSIELYMQSNTDLPTGSVAAVAVSITSLIEQAMAAIKDLAQIVADALAQP